MVGLAQTALTDFHVVGARHVSSDPVKGRQLLVVPDDCDGVPEVLTDQGVRAAAAAARVHLGTN